MQDNDFLTAEQVELLIKATTNKRHQLQIILQTDAGLRVTEVTSLKWEHLDFRTKMIEIRSLKKKANDPKPKRLLPMSGRVYDAFAAYINENGKGTGFIFSTDGGKTAITRQAISKMLKDIEHKSSQLNDLHPHKLRHSFATNLRAAGAELEDIRDALGHTKLETSLIYAHQNPEALRALMDARAKKPVSFWQKLKSIFLPKAKKQKISILDFDQKFTVGREFEIKRIEAALNKEISVVMVGPVGVGKSHILNALKFNKPVLELDDLKDFKKTIINTLLWLFGGDKEQVATMIFTKPERDAMHNKMTKESTMNLCDLLIRVTNQYEYILKIGDIEDVTPAVTKAIDVLKNHFIIVTTCRSIKLTSHFIWNFEKIEIKPLGRMDANRLFHKLTDQLDFDSAEHARNKVFEVSEGNPKMTVELAQRLAKEDDTLCIEIVNEVCDNYIGRQTREIDMSFLLLIAAGCIMAMRYLGKEAHEPDLRMMGGLMMILMLFARTFFRGAGKRKSL